MKTILITGGAGFIGSNFIPYFLERYAEYHVINYDALTYAGNLNNLEEVEDHPRYTFVKGNICDRARIDELFEQYDFFGVIHFAAESHVDNSIAGPREFFKTNVLGTFELVDAARQKWLLEPFRYREEYAANRFLQISTDEVYGSLGPEGLFTEETPHAPNSPYSASKAAADFLVRSYFHTYGMNVLTTNCSNNYGPKQHKEKLIPTIMRHALSGKPIPIYAAGKNVRDWLYVRDHCLGIDLVFHHGRFGQTYNLGGRNERTNNEIVNSICDLLDRWKPSPNGKSYKELITYVKDRAGHDLRYAIDAAKIEKELNWRPEENFVSGIEKTVQWYLSRSDS